MRRKSFSIFSFFFFFKYFKRKNFLRTANTRIAFCYLIFRIKYLFFALFRLFKKKTFTKKKNYKYKCYIDSISIFMKYSTTFNYVNKTGKNKKLTCRVFSRYLHITFIRNKRTI